VHRLCETLARISPIIGRRMILDLVILQSLILFVILFSLRRRLFLVSFLFSFVLVESPLFQAWRRRWGRCIGYGRRARWRASGTGTTDSTRGSRCGSSSVLVSTYVLIGSVHMEDVLVYVFYVCVGAIWCIQRLWKACFTVEGSGTGTTA
jgi:hypothetical protein